MTTIKEITEELAVTKAKIKKLGSEAIGSHFEKFFEEFPNVKQIVWTQYAPHFNDGDACTFSVHDPRLHSFKDEDESEWEDSPESELGEGAVEAFDELWRQCDDDILEQIFGQEAKVVVTRETVEVEEYDHD